MPIAEDCYCPLRAGFKPTGHEYLKFGVSGVLRMLESDRPNDLRRVPRVERLPSEETVDSLASEGESLGFAASE